MNPSNGKGSEGLHTRTKKPHADMQESWDGIFRDVKGQFSVTSEGKGASGSIQNECNLCGWIGQKYYGDNPYQNTKCRDERFEHECQDGEC